MPVLGEGPQGGEGEEGEEFGGAEQEMRGYVEEEENAGEPFGPVGGHGDWCVVGGQKLGRGEVVQVQCPAYFRGFGMRQSRSIGIHLQLSIVFQHHNLS